MAIGWRIPIHNGHGAGLPLLLRHQVSVHETIHGRQDKEDEHRRGDHTSYDDARQELLCGRGLPSLWRSCGSWAFRFLRRHLGSVPPGAPPPPAGDHASLGGSCARSRQEVRPPGVHWSKGWSSAALLVLELDQHLRTEMGRPGEAKRAEWLGESCGKPDSYLCTVSTLRGRPSYRHQSRASSDTWLWGGCHPASTQ